MEQLYYEEIPDAVKIVCMGELVQVFVDVNPTPVERQYSESGEPWRGYSVQHSEFVCRRDEIDLADVQAHPEKYLDYTPAEANAKERAKNDVQAWLDKALKTRKVIPCEGIPAGIIYDTEALINALGMTPGMTFIDAADGLHEVTAELRENVGAALGAYRADLYAAATTARKAIDAAGDAAGARAAVASLPMI